MHRKTRTAAPILLIAPMVLAFGLSAAPIGPVHAFGHDSLRAMVGQALVAPARTMDHQASKATGQPLMMVQSDMMRRMSEMPGPGRMMSRVGEMMDQGSMPGRMREMMGEDGMTDQMSGMMEDCSEMMQGMGGGQRPNEQWQDRQPEPPQPEGNAG